MACYALIRVLDGEINLASICIWCDVLQCPSTLCSLLFISDGHESHFQWRYESDMKRRLLYM